jgi:hypothetical protein
MQHAQMVEVNLRVQLLALLVHLVVLRGFILFLSVETRWVGTLGISFTRCSIEQVRRGFVGLPVDGVQIRLDMGQQTAMLLGSWLE